MVLPINVAEKIRFFQPAFPRFSWLRGAPYSFVIFSEAPVISASALVIHEIMVIDPVADRFCRAHPCVAGFLACLMMVYLSQDIRYEVSEGLAGKDLLVRCRIMLQMLKQLKWAWYFQQMSFISKKQFMLSNLGMLLLYPLTLFMALLAMHGKD